MSYLQSLAQPKNCLLTRDSALAAAPGSLHAGRSKSRAEGLVSVTLVTRLSGVQNRSLPLAHCGETWSG